MDMTTTMINDRSLSKELDGKRPSAGGMPSNQEGNDNYEYWYARADKYYKKFWDWSSERWKQEWLQCADTRAYGHDGWLACIEDYRSRQIDREVRFRNVSNARDKLSRELGPREFTLTYSPAWYGDDELAKDALRVAIDKLTRYYKDEIIEFHAIGEYTEAGRAHVHCYYELDGGVKITDKNFKRAWKHWAPTKKLGTGHQGGHHANVRSKSDFLGYIEKDLETAWMNVHITRDADDHETTQRARDPQELQGDRGDEDA